ncbi:MAG: secretin N-terminal domain-containing protein, partial [Janthinobacterium lividum]
MAVNSFKRIVAAGLVALPSAVTAAPASATIQVADVVVNMRDVEIALVAEQVSRITGRTLILDPAVKGQVNVVSAEALSPVGVWDLFRSVLRVYGFAAVRSGAAWRIVPQASAVQGGAVAATGQGSARAQDVVTRIVPLHNLPSDAAARIFRPLVAGFGSIEALPSPNAVLVTDYAENVRRIERLAQDLDGGAGTVFDGLSFKFASARDVAAAIQRIAGDGSAPGSPKIAVDERSNLLLICGDARAVADARRMAALLDTPGGSVPTTRVFRLSFADAETVTDVLRGLTGAPPVATNPLARSLSKSRPAFAGPSSRGAQVAGKAGQSGDSEIAPGDGIRADAAVRPTPQGIQTDDVSIQPAPELNAIVVRGTPGAVAAIATLIDQLDVRRPQVLIEAAIAEVTGDAAEQLGIQFGFGRAAVAGGGSGGTSFGSLGTSLASVVTALLPGAAGVGLLSEGLSLIGGSHGDFSVLVQAL